MDMSVNGLMKLTQWEGSKTQAYQDSVGVWTIGVGHTAAAGPPKPVRGMKISNAEITKILANDLVQYENAVEKAVKVPMLQHEFDMMVSLCFNIGAGAFAKSSVAKAFNAKDKKQAANNFLKWNKGRINGKLVVIKGLTNRRQAERLIFLEGYPKTMPMASLFGLEHMGEIGKEVDQLIKENIVEAAKIPTKAEVTDAVVAIAEANAANKGFKIGRYSKLIAAVGGNVLAIFIAWLAVQFPSVAECRVVQDMTDACTVLGFTQAQITGALMLLINTYFVYQAPANDPPA